jgi:hypothetical protein
MNLHKKPVVLAIESLFEQLNFEFFGGGLAIPTHVIHPEKKVVFKFDPHAYAIWIGAGFADVKNDLVLNYLHEMIHIWNANKRAVDCTSNQYHNKKFLDRALACGLFVTRHKTQGWSQIHWDEPKRVKKIDLCTPTQGALDKCKEIISTIKLDNAVIIESRTTLKMMLDGNKPKQCFLKYVCKCKPPYNSIRSGRMPDGPNAPKIKCLKCDESFSLCK